MNLSKFKETRASADTNRNVKFTLAHGIGNLGSKLSTKIHAYTHAPKIETEREKKKGGSETLRAPTKKKKKGKGGKLWLPCDPKNATPFWGLLKGGASQCKFVWKPNSE